MEMRTSLLLSSLLFVATACGESGVPEFSQGAARILGSSKQHEAEDQRSAGPRLARAERLTTPEIHDIDDAVDSAEATPEGDPASTDSGSVLTASDPADDPAESGEEDGEAQVWLVDAQIAAVLTAANSAISGQAQAALRTLHGEAHRTLAADLAMAHAAAEARQTAIVSEKRLTPKENEVSTAFAQYAAAQAAKLGGASDCETEQSYLALLIATHEELLAVFDEVLLRSVCDGALKAELALARAELASELLRARALLPTAL
jgi:predicted outer membrane protein